MLYGDATNSAPLIVTADKILSEGLLGKNSVALKPTLKIRIEGASWEHSK